MKFFLINQRLSSIKYTRRMNLKYKLRARDAMSKQQKENKKSNQI